MLMQNPATSIRATLNAAQRRLDAWKAERQKLVRPDGSDFDALVRHEAELEVLDRNIRIGTENVRSIESQLCEAETVLAAKAAKEKHRRADNAAEADAKKIPAEIEALTLKLADARDRLAASVARTKAANDTRGELPYIEDAEFRVRKQPGETVSEIATWGDVHVDADGNPVAKTIWDMGQFKNIPNPAYASTERRKHVIRPAMQLPPRMPERYETAIKLVDSAGNPL